MDTIEGSRSTNFIFFNSGADLLKPILQKVEMVNTDNNERIFSPTERNLLLSDGGWTFTGVKHDLPVVWKFSHNPIKVTPLQSETPENDDRDSIQILPSKHWEENPTMVDQIQKEAMILLTWNHEDAVQQPGDGDSYLYSDPKEVD